MDDTFRLPDEEHGLVLDEEHRAALEDRQAKRLKAFQVKPKGALFKLFESVENASRTTPHILWLLFYLFTFLKISLIGLMVALDVSLMSRTASFNAQSIGHRLRLKKSIGAYQLLARAGVGAQHFLRKVRVYFCDANEIDLDGIIDSLHLPKRPTLLFGDAHSGAARTKHNTPTGDIDVRFGETVGEARESLEQLVSAEVCAPYFERLDELWINLCTFLGFCFSLVGIAVINSLDPRLLLSLVFFPGLQKSCGPPSQ